MANASIESEEREFQNVYKKFINKSLTTITDLSNVDKEYITEIMMRKFNDERKQTLRRLIVMSKIMSGTYQLYPTNGFNIARILFEPIFNERLPLKSILLASDGKFEIPDYLIRLTRKDSDGVAETIELINYLLSAINKRCSIHSIQARIYGSTQENTQDIVEEKSKSRNKIEINEPKNLGRKVAINDGNDKFITNKNIILSVIFTDDTVYKFVLSWVVNESEKPPLLYIRRILPESSNIDYIPYIDTSTLDLI